MTVKAPESFDPAKPVVARIPFTFRGTPFVKGQPFDWQAFHEVDPRRIESMFRTGMIQYGKADKPAPKKRQKVAPPSAA